MVRDTSKAAYSEINENGTASRQQQEILDSIPKGRDYSLQEIALMTEKPINVVSGRVCELKNKGLLVHGPRRACRVTGKTIHPVMKPE